MPRKGKLWVPVDVHFTTEVQMAGLTPSAAMLFLEAIAWSKVHYRNGHILRSICHGFRFYSARNRDALERAGWMVRTDNGDYYIPSWDKWHESKEAVDQRLRQDRNRKRLANGISRGAFRMPD